MKLNRVIRICDQVRFNQACPAKVTSYDIQILPEVGLTVDTTKRANKNSAGLNVIICRLICAFVVHMWQNQEFSHQSRINMSVSKGMGKKVNPDYFLQTMIIINKAFYQQYLLKKSKQTFAMVLISWPG